MAINFGGVTPELKTLCKYQFPQLTSPNCSRFAARPGRNSTLEENEFDEGEEEEGEDLFEAWDRPPSKRHVWANVWERSLDPRGCNLDPTDTWTIDWRQWPPDVARISQGVKIPVGLASNPSLRVMEATPLNSGTAEFYGSLKGLFNPCQTSAFTVHPPALLFLNSRIGQFYSVKLRLKNVDTVPRRVMFVPPKNQDFFITWTTRQTLPIVPGLSVPILVEFRPRSNVSLNEVLFITVEGAGGLTVPLVACAEAPPILEVEEWDCGCSVTNVARGRSFEIKNVGNEARFWILTENEFRYQYLAYPKRRPEPDANTDNALMSSKRQIKRQSDGKDVPEGIQRNSKSTRPNFGGGGVVSVTAGPFSINTAGFKLLRNQRIRIKVKFLPKKPGLHYQKLAVLCDNGEVRWIAIKGMGIDFYSNGLLDLKVATYWTAPPIDLPFDEKCRFALDLGDIFSSEQARGQVEFRVENKSCIKMYYFWGVRPLRVGFIPVTSTPTTEGNHGRNCFSIFPEGTIQPSDGSDEQQDSSGGRSHTLSSKDGENKQVVDLRILPAQGILGQRQVADFSISASCPHEIGYYACVLSLFIEQLEEISVPAVTAFIKGLEDTGMNDVPIHEDFLKEALLTKKGELSSPKGKKRHNGIFELDDEGESLAFLLHPKRKHHEECEDPEPLVKRHPSGGDSFDNFEGGLLSSSFTGGEGEVDENGDKLADNRRAYPKPKSWARNAGVLEPIVEIEIWLRCIPLQITFTPPFIVGKGVVSSRMEREIKVTNESQWPVEIQLNQVLERAGSVCCQPGKLVLQPLEQTWFTAVICLKAHGMIDEPISGTINVIGSTTMVPISLQCCISSTGPYIMTLTPLIHFGFIQINSEKMKTIAIKNMGDRPARWEACVNAEDLVDEEGHNLTPHNCNIVGMNLLRVWPTWGVLEPGEVMGINVYLSAEIEGDIIGSITLSVQDVPDSIIVVPVLGVVQSPFLYLEETEVFVDKESLFKNKVEDASVTLVNPTGSPITFVWQPCLIGSGSAGLDVEFCPGTNFVPPRGTMDVVLSLDATRTEYVNLKHIYAVCMVDGMKEPLILKISEKSGRDSRDREEEDDCYPFWFPKDSQAKEMQELWRVNNYEEGEGYFEGRGEVANPGAKQKGQARPSGQVRPSGQARPSGQQGPGENKAKPVVGDQLNRVNNPGKGQSGQKGVLDRPSQSTEKDSSSGRDKGNEKAKKSNVIDEQLDEESSSGGQPKGSGGSTGPSNQKGQGSSSQKGQDASSKSSQGPSNQKGASTQKGQGPSSEENQGSSNKNGQVTSSQKGQDVSSKKSKSRSSDEKGQDLSSKKSKSRSSDEKGQDLSSKKSKSRSSDEKGQDLSNKKSKSRSSDEKDQSVSSKKSKSRSSDEKDQSVSSKKSKSRSSDEKGQDLSNKKSKSRSSKEKDTDLSIKQSKSRSSKEKDTDLSSKKSKNRSSDEKGQGLSSKKSKSRSSKEKDPDLSSKKSKSRSSNEKRQDPSSSRTGQESSDESEDPSSKKGPGSSSQKGQDVSSGKKNEGSSSQKGQGQSSEDDQGSSTKEGQNLQSKKGQSSSSQKGASSKNGQDTTSEDNQDPSSKKGQGSSSQKGQGTSSKNGQNTPSEDNQDPSSKKGQGSSSQKGQGTSSKNGQNTPSEDNQDPSSQKGQGSANQKGQGSSKKGDGSSSPKGEDTSSKKGQDPSSQGGQGSSNQKGQSSSKKGDGFSSPKGEDTSSKKGQDPSSQGGQGSSNQKGQGSSKKGDGFSSPKGEDTSSKGQDPSSQNGHSNQKGQSPSSQKGASPPSSDQGSGTEKPKSKGLDDQLSDEVSSFGDHIPGHSPVSPVSAGSESEGSSGGSSVVRPVRVNFSRGPIRLFEKRFMRFF